MKKALLTLFTVSALTSCNDANSANQSVANPASSKNYWTEFVNATPSDSNQIKTVALQHLENGKFFSKKEIVDGREGEYNHTSVTGLIMENSDTLALVYDTKNTHYFTNDTTEDASRRIILLKPEDKRYWQISQHGDGTATISKDERMTRRVLAPLYR